ncbi:hypothetical protein ILUMI_23651 [Ignelater luminosus]|uniref:Uncharacterized protein n=1 Tax=Ignelater luminosus TaxID=2038154 RepID=A0A8K0C7N5_IGNLU|nr:hypothetical protein ILUMI_23651 [Ignelater luminosus]
MDGKGQIVFGKDISINDQNLEEAEELEDRKRREEEIHNLLSHAMGEFNYDDQSTLNSSVASNDGEHAGILPQEVRTAFEEQYREVSADEQLKVLYEVRVREVIALNNELEKFQKEFKNQEQSLKKKIVLLEIENERKNISLKESQELLAEKVDQIKSLEGQIECMQGKTKNLESNLAELNEENAIFREANRKLEQQVALMERGFPLFNKINDKELQESQRNKISQLEDMLEKTREQNERKEHQYKEATRELKQNLQEKDNFLTEKNILITKLTENYENVQRQCQELLKSVEELKRSKKTVERTESPLEEELRKIREKNESTDILSENIRKVVSNEFQVQVSNLTSENIKLRDMLFNRDKEFKEVEHQLQKMKNLQNENEVLYQKILEIESARQSVEERCIQTSFSSLDNTELTNLQKEKEDICNELAAAHATINELQNTLTLTRQENSQLKIKVNLEQERDVLIKQLQEKAAQFEKIILEKQRKLVQTNMNSVGTNTESKEANGSVLKIKYDASLFQLETKLRKKLKEEFDTKFEKFVEETQQKANAHVCENCKNIKEENKRLIEMRTKDRQCVAKLIERWKEKFLSFQKETQCKIVAFKAAYKQYVTETVTKLEQEYADKHNKLIENIKVISADLGHRNNKLLHYNLQGHTLLSEKLNVIIKSIQQGNEEVTEIEKRCTEKRAALEKSHH